MSPVVAHIDDDFTVKGCETGSVQEWGNTKSEIAFLFASCNFIKSPTCCIATERKQKTDSDTITCVTHTLCRCVVWHACMLRPLLLMTMKMTMPMMYFKTCVYMLSAIACGKQYIYAYFMQHHRSHQWPKT